MTEIQGLAIFGPAGSSDANIRSVAFAIMKEAKEERVEGPGSPDITFARVGTNHPGVPVEYIFPLHSLMSINDHYQ